jgi:hypothetical protein
MGSENGYRLRRALTSRCDLVVPASLAPTSASVQPPFRNGFVRQPHAKAEALDNRAAMALSLYAGIPVSVYEAAKPWSERLLGVEPSFIAHATEAVWELAEPRSVFAQRDRISRQPACRLEAHSRQRVLRASVRPGASAFVRRPLEPDSGACRERPPACAWPKGRCGLSHAGPNFKSAGV